MKVVDVSRFEVVRAGVPCFTPPPVHVETIAKLMERNEDYIFWLQPPGKGVEAQVACVQINSVFYQLNMRLEKAIFRHIRLNRDFQNLEKLEDGTPKLRIPTLSSPDFSVRVQTRGEGEALVEAKARLSYVLELLREWCCNAGLPAVEESLLAVKDVKRFKQIVKTFSVPGAKPIKSSVWAVWRRSGAVLCG